MRRMGEKHPALVTGILQGMLVIALLTWVAIPADGKAPPDAAFVGSATCLDCHDEIGEAFQKTVHGLAYAADDSRGAVSCESCHGPGSAHIEEADPALITNPATADQFEDSPLCLGCHNTPEFDDWSFSHHQAADLNCSSCHTIHASPEAAMANRPPELCYTCHADIRAESFMPSHHPVREGKLSCLDCHGVHGGEARLVQDNTGREMCFTCHADKEGPFVYEHAPVMEDCSICHTPHGSVSDNLLVQSEPALCLNCHAMHFHATVVGLDETTEANDRTIVSTTDGWKKGMLTKCTQCHAEVHGSDLPSQALSTSGNALTR
ncbi:MAG: DmsE family decaheme c-type cytochrome [candidate division Zixibacteria bacterium]|nr:DmsE family decaheme c-type cytochrome [candidate division Zixibacteria bacterium]